MNSESNEKSWEFFEEVINEFPDDRVSQNDEFIRVIGDSGTPYRFTLNDEMPFSVFREVGEDLVQLSIIATPHIESHPLGDLYCALLLALFHDEEQLDFLSHLREDDDPDNDAEND